MGGGCIWKPPPLSLTDGEDREAGKPWIGKEWELPKRKEPEVGDPQTLTAPVREWVVSKTTHIIAEDTQSSLTDKGQLRLERPVFNDAHWSLESSQIFQAFPNLAFPALTFLTILSLSHGIWSTLQPVNFLSFLKHPITRFLFPSRSFCMEWSFHTLLCNRFALPMRTGPTFCLCFPPLCFCTSLYALYPNTYRKPYGTCFLAAAPPQGCEAGAAACSRLPSQDWAQCLAYSRHQQLFVE